MNSYQLKQSKARSRSNNAQKVQRPLLNFKASKDKAKDRRKSSSNDQNQDDICRGDTARAVSSYSVFISSFVISN